MSVSTKAEIAALRAEMEPIEAHLQRCAEAVAALPEARRLYAVAEDQRDRDEFYGHRFDPLPFNLAKTRLEEAEIRERQAKKAQAEWAPVHQEQLERLAALHGQLLDEIWAEYRPAAEAGLIAAALAARHEFGRLLGKLVGIAEVAMSGPRPGSAAAWHEVTAALRSPARPLVDREAGRELLAAIEAGTVEYGELPWEQRAA